MIPINDKKKKTMQEDKQKEAEKQSVVTEETAEAAEEAKTAEAAEQPGEEAAAETCPKADYELLNDKYLRVCAEYDNFRKRTQKEKDGLYYDVRASVISSFLPVYDNLTRALATETVDEAYRKGVEMIMNQFNTTLEKLGAEAIPAVGEKFDPTLHNAVMHVDDETKGENEVVEEFQKGFKIGEKIIRFSMVKVAN